MRPRAARHALVADLERGCAPERGELDAKTGERETRAETAVGLICYALHDFAPRLVAARPDRQWMDRFPDQHAYRCLPLSIANAHGWHVLCPAPVEIEWNGGPAVADIKVRAL